MLDQFSMFLRKLVNFSSGGMSLSFDDWCFEIESQLIFYRRVNNRWFWKLICSGYQPSLSMYSLILFKTICLFCNIQWNNFVIRRVAGPWRTCIFYIKSILLHHQRSGVGYSSCKIRIRNVGVCSANATAVPTLFSHRLILNFKNYFFVIHVSQFFTRFQSEHHFKIYLDLKFPFWPAMVGENGNTLFEKNI